MSENLYGRRAKLVIARPITDLKSTAPNAVEITDLRIQFKVRKSGSKDPNTAKITVTNLSASTRAKLQGDGHRVILEAGYPETISTLFTGDSTRILHKQSGADWVTEIEAVDGGRAYRDKNTTVSFKSGTSYRTVAEELLKRLGLSTEQTADLTGAFVTGFSFVGPVVRGLDTVLKAAGVDWSIQNNKVQILGRNATTNAPVLELGPTTGLIGSPEWGSAEKGKRPPVVARALLAGRIAPGGRVALNASEFKGGFKVLECEHEGDTAGGAWYTRFEATPL
jgi:hypothetical protein